MRVRRLCTWGDCDTCEAIMNAREVIVNAREAIMNAREMIVNTHVR
jgi:hypothetical protein